MNPHYIGSKASGLNTIDHLMIVLDAFSPRRWAILLTSAKDGDGLNRVGPPTALKYERPLADLFEIALPHTDRG